MVGVILVPHRPALRQMGHGRVIEVLHLNHRFLKRRVPDHMGVPEVLLVPGPVPHPGVHVYAHKTATAFHKALEGAPLLIIQRFQATHRGEKYPAVGQNFVAENLGRVVGVKGLKAVFLPRQSQELPGRFVKGSVPGIVNADTDDLLEDGDIITIDIPGRKLEVKLSDEELQKRREAWQPPAPKIAHGCLARYARLVSSGSTGAVLK